MSGSPDTPNQSQEAKKLWLPRSATGSGSSGAGRGRRRSGGGGIGRGQPHSIEGWGEKRDAVKEWTQDPPTQHIVPSLTPTPTPRPPRTCGIQASPSSSTASSSGRSVGTHKEDVTSGIRSSKCVPETYGVAPALLPQTWESRPQPPPSALGSKPKSWRVG